MEEISGHAAAAVGADYAGVDLLFDGREYTVLEVNGTPNWHCMKSPIPKILARYLIREERSMRTLIGIVRTNMFPPGTITQTVKTIQGK